ncbi:CAP domain-containing protein [Sphingobacteriales bacterium UPWRP_1]|nr:hypothetical protein BVG80_07170 [Sphingobacteriales bacterium TSM_CSM]PSJ78211.1 CAP domain-containing protein [Sphingobacteriales bacterium UPWRP_1]
MCIISGGKYTNSARNVVLKPVLTCNKKHFFSDMRICLLLLAVMLCAPAGIACNGDKNIPPTPHPVPVTGVHAGSIIDPKNFDELLLAKLLLEQINQLRNKKGAKPLNPDELLAKAANEQNNYITAKSKLSHEQTNAQMRDVQKRVAYFGGDYDMVGENLQLFGFMVTTRGRNATIEYTTYEQAAEGMLQNWERSKPHYENLVRKEFTRAGTAIGFNKDKTGFYATQVYASNMASK